MNENFDEMPSESQRREYKFLWLKLRKPERKETYQTLFSLIAVLLGGGLATLFPQKNCTCEDQVTDLRLETLAREGNKQVINYQQERESVIVCAAKREELLKRLEQQKKQRLNKKTKAN